jgi:hypothetical protein
MDRLRSLAYLGIALQKRTNESPVFREQWETDFESASNNQAKFKVLREALGHGNFSLLRAATGIGHVINGSTAYSST